MIVFKKLRWRNFLSTGTIFTEIDFNRHKTTLVIGKNGAGKSTMLDALFFVLYNEPYREGLNKPQLINSINKKDVVVECEFSIGSNDYLVRRGIKPAIFEIYINNELRAQDAASADYQEFLENKILKINKKAFGQIVVIGSAFVPFMNLKSAPRRAIVDDLLDVNVFTTMNALLKDEAKSTEKQINELDHQIDLLDQRIEYIRKAQEERDQDIDAEITDKNDQIAKTEVRISDARTSLKEKLEVARGLQEQLKPERKVKNTAEQFKTIRYQLEEKIKRLELDIDFFNNTDVCPTCNQGIDEHFKVHTIECKAASKTKTEDGYKQLIDNIKEVDQQLDYFKQLNAQLTDINMDVALLNQEITSCNDLIVRIAKEIKRLEQKKAPADGDSDNINEVNAELKVLRRQKAALLEQRDIQKVTALLLKDGGIKGQVIKQYLPVINKTLNKYLAALDFFVNIELDEQFNETIRSRFRDEFSFASFSEGEKDRINIAILFTWRQIAKLRNNANTNLLILDEVFDGSLDAGGVDEMMKILNQLSPDTNTFIISHKSDQLFDRFEFVLKFEKHRNFSRIATDSI